MEKLFLLIVGLIAVLIALVIGVRADDHQSPHAFAIITGAVGALVMLVRAIAEHLRRTRTQSDEPPGVKKVNTQVPQRSRPNGNRTS